MGRDGLICKIFSPTVYEPAMAPEGGQVVILQKVLEMDYAAVGDWAAHKAEVERFVTAHLERVLPGIGEHVEVQHSASALTSWRFTANTAGAMLGWEMSPDQLGAARPGIEPPVDGLYLTGHWVRPGGGITPVIVSACQVVERVTGSRLLHSGNALAAVTARPAGGGGVAVSRRRGGGNGHGDRRAEEGDRMTSDGMEATMDAQRVDVAILGSGLAGLSLARHLLLDTGKTVALVDRSAAVPVERQKVGESSVQLAGYYYSRVLDMEEHLLRHHYMKYNLRFYWKTPGASRAASRTARRPTSASCRTSPATSSTATSSKPSCCAATAPRRSGSPCWRRCPTCRSSSARTAPITG